MANVTLRLRYFISKEKDDDLTAEVKSGTTKSNDVLGLSWVNSVLLGLSWVNSVLLGLSWVNSVLRGLSWADSALVCPVLAAR